MMSERKFRKAVIRAAKFDEMKIPAQEGTVGYPEFKIELSEPALHTEIGKRWPEAEIDEDFQLCEEPEAAENEMMKNVIQAGEVVARIYTIRGGD